MPRDFESSEKDAEVTELSAEDSEDIVLAAEDLGIDMRLDEEQGEVSMDSKVPGTPSIPEWYRGRAILITGGSGFMGKVLVEKLLRSCPDLRTIYLLLRARKGRCARSRIDDITQQPLFGRLRREDPSAIHKLVAIEGDVMQVGLGLSADDRRLLEREVSVVFHSAASVRFDDSMRKAILMNVRGTREVLELARNFRHLQAFVHFSTTFSNCEQQDVGEHLYPPPGGLDWRLAIRIAENEKLDPALTYLTPILLDKKANTYVFAKSLGEHVVNDHRHQLPVVIVRPSIVTSAFEEPVPGWIDNFNGPIAYWVGCYTGVLRVIYAKGENWMDLVPVDSAVKSIIYIAYHRALSTPTSAEQLAVFNCSTLVEPITFREQSYKGLCALEEVPTTQMIWKPSQLFTTIWPLFYVNFMVTHVLPAFFIDAALIYRDEKPRFMRMYRRMYIAIKTMYIFTNIFTFHNDKFLAIEETMLLSDRAAFAYSTPKQLDKANARIVGLGTRAFLLNDPMETLPRARRLLRRFFWLDLVLKTLFLSGVGWVLAQTLMATLPSFFTETTAVATCQNLLQGHAF